MTVAVQTQDLAGVMTQGRLDRLQALGHDFLEAKREGAYVYDEEGRRYLDACASAGIFNLGRHNAELACELKLALRETDIGNFPMISCEKAALAKALSDFVPGPLECSIFSVVRGEAMEAACKAARGFTGRSELVTVDGGWYGQTGFALSISDRKDKDSFGPLIPNVRTMPFGGVEAARKTIGSDTAAVILEPVQAENHCRAATPEYVNALAGLCRERGAVLILDETQTGFGRTGTKFAYESSGITPDILVLGEALGGGMFPIAATLLTQRVNAFMNAHPLIHLSTFGGADVGCRVASKAIEIYSREKPWRNAAEMGERLLVSLRQLQRQAGSLMRDVTGRGLLLSLDLGSPENAKRFCKAAAAHGLLVLPGEVAAYTIVLRPSLTVTAEQADEIVASVRAALENL